MHCVLVDPPETSLRTSIKRKGKEGQGEEKEEKRREEKEEEEHGHPVASKKNEINQYLLQTGKTRVSSITIPLCRCPGRSSPGP